MKLPIFLLLLILSLFSCENKQAHLKRPDKKADTPSKGPTLFDSTLIDNWQLNRITFYRYIQDKNNRKRPGGRMLQSKLLYDNDERLVIGFDKDYKMYCLDSLIGSYEYVREK